MEILRVTIMAWIICILITRILFGKLIDSLHDKFDIDNTSFWVRNAMRSFEYVFAPIIVIVFIFSTIFFGKQDRK